MTTADIEALTHALGQTLTTATESPTAAEILASIRAALDLPPIPPVKLPCDDCTKLNERRSGLPLGSVSLCPACFARSTP